MRQHSEDYLKLAEQVRHFLLALDSGYFGPEAYAGMLIGDEESAFLRDLRQAVEVQP